MMGTAVFVVDSFAIDATNANFSNGTAADLAVGRVVHVEGTRGQRHPQREIGRIRRRRVGRRRQHGESPAGGEVDDVDGAISAFVSAANFVVHGITIDASAATFVNGAITDLANGKIVNVFGVRSGMTMTATKVVFDIGDGGEPEIDDVDGAITAFTSVASFVVDGITVDASAATFANGAAGDLAVGKVVKVVGTRTGSSMQATTVTFVNRIRRRRQRRRRWRR